MTYRPSYSNQSSSSVYRPSYGSRTEISMRDELVKTLDGFGPEIAKKQTGLLRQMRREDGELLPCACVNPTSGEPDRDTPCPLCLGEGYYWDETRITFYRFEPGADTGLALKERLTIPGDVNVSFRVFYLDWTRDLHSEDKVIELLLDKAGEPIEPLQRKAVYKMGYLYPYRLDNGRLEYWKCVAYEEKILRNALNVG